MLTGLKRRAESAPKTARKPASKKGRKGDNPLAMPDVATDDLLPRQELSPASTSRSPDWLSSPVTKRPPSPLMLPPVTATREQYEAAKSIYVQTVIILIQIWNLYNLEEEKEATSEDLLVEHYVNLSHNFNLFVEMSATYLRSSVRPLTEDDALQISRLHAIQLTAKQENAIVLLSLFHEAELSDLHPLSLLQYSIDVLEEEKRRHVVIPVRTPEEMAEDEPFPTLESRCPSLY